MSILLRRFAPKLLSVLAVGALYASACSDSSQPANPIAGASGSGGGVAGSGGAGGVLAGGAGGTKSDAGGNGGSDAQADAPWPDGSGLDPDELWIADKSLWSVVPNTSGFKNCQVLQPAGKLPLAALTWTTCGSGCELTDPVRFGKGAYMPTMSTFRDSTGATRAFVAFMENKLADDWVHQVRRFVDLMTGESIGAVSKLNQFAQTSPCSFGRDFESARFSSVTGSEIKLYFCFDPAGGAVWAPAPIASSEDPFLSGKSFDIDQPKPRILYGGGGSTIYSYDLIQNGWTVFAQSETLDDGVGEDDLGVWVSAPQSGVQRLRGWRDDGAGIFTLADSVPAETCALAISADRIVGLASDAWKCTQPTEVRLWRASRSNPESDLTLSPALPVEFDQRGSVQTLQTWGNFAVLISKAFDPALSMLAPRLYVIELSTWKLWRIDPRPGMAWMSGAFTLDEEYIYLSEQPPNAGQQLNSKEVATGIVRIPISAMAQSVLAKPLP